MSRAKSGSADEEVDDAEGKGVDLDVFEAGGGHHLLEFFGRGEGGDGFLEVAVFLAAGEKAADAGDGVVDVESGHGSHGTLAGFAEFEDHDAAAGAGDAGHFLEAFEAVGEIADSERDGGTVKMVVVKREGQAVAFLEGDAVGEVLFFEFLVADGEHFDAGVDAIDLDVRVSAGDFHGEVGGAGGDIEDVAGVGEVEGLDGFFAPVGIEAHGEDAVEEVVAVGDGVEELATAAVEFVADAGEVGFVRSGGLGHLVASWPCCREGLR